MQKTKIEFLQNYSLEVAVIICGGVLMATEIAGGRLLSADYGATVYVWGSIIAIILCGLSVGYYGGGRLADTRPRSSLLAFLIGIAAVLVALIPLLYQWGVRLFTGMNPTFAPLCAVLLFFLLPSLLLGMISPFAIKLKATELRSIGRTSGNLYALATIGSVVGTFLTTFGLVIWFPVSGIFFGLSLCLVVAAFLLAKGYRVYAVLLFALILLLALFRMRAASSVHTAVAGQPTSQTGEVVVAEVESLYGQLKVVDDDGVRSLSINGGTMGAIRLDDKFKTADLWEHIDGFEQLALLRPGSADVLNLGIGPGLVADRLSERHNIQVDAVDINNDVITTAEKYFGLVPNPNLSLHVEDARVFLKKTSKQYDVIESDIFKYNRGSYDIPPHLTTREFFQEAKARLKPNGIFSMLVVETGTFIQSQLATLQTEFKYVYNFKCANTHLLAASDSPIDAEAFSKKAPCLQESFDVHGATIFTDDYAPVNQLGGK